MILTSWLGFGFFVRILDLCYDFGFMLGFCFLVRILDLWLRF